MALPDPASDNTEARRIYEREADERRDRSEEPFRPPVRPTPAAKSGKHVVLPKDAHVPK